MKNSRKFPCPTIHKMVATTVIQNKNPIRTFGVTVNLKNGSIVVIEDINAPYRLKTLIANYLIHEFLILTISLQVQVIVLLAYFHFSF
jgi:hypothetical protein